MDQPSAERVREALIARPGQPFDLGERASRDERFFERKPEAEASLAADALAIDELQDRLYAEGKRALLVILQGMDTSGKSGAIKAVFEATSPLGVTVKAFKPPSDEERAHDFLWRIHQATPKRGFIGVFDRSHYEDVLVAKVRRLAPQDEIERRYRQINAFEKHLVENGTVILKCMLNVGHDVQAERLRDRLEKPHKRWKFNPGDLDDREHWDAYMQAYGTMIERCSTDIAPWFVVPADSKIRRNALVGRLVRAALEDMNPDYPDPGYRLDQFEIT